MKDHTVLSLSPDEKYPRHSEGAFLRLKNGDILFIYSRFKNSNDDDGPSDLVKLVSHDEGESWEEAGVAVSADMYNVQNVMSVSLMRMQNGDVGLFYLVKSSPSVNKIMLSRSKDEGKTFCSHSECTYFDREGYYVLNNDRAIRLISGRIILPLSFHRTCCGELGPFVHFDGRAVGYFLCSDDDGETWFESDDAVFPPFSGSNSGLQEAGAEEIRDGVVLGYFRTDMMYQYESFSIDGGMHWTAAQPSRFTSPCSPMKIKKNPFNDKFYAVWNPIPSFNGRKTPPGVWGRTPIVWAESDDGLSFGEYKIIEDREDHGYCYPALFFTNDNAMLVAYCAGNEEDGGCLCRLNIRKIAL
ncbi:MAG: glycoside hydrolase [Clostridiales bacterium]|nr:glycoside hydrolase [Clostridiales bacterium]